jgi:hypothetical protein
LHLFVCRFTFFALSSSNKGLQHLTQGMLNCNMFKPGQYRYKCAQSVRPIIAASVCALPVFSLVSTLARPIMQEILMNSDMASVALYIATQMSPASSGIMQTLHAAKIRIAVSLDG